MKEKNKKTYLKPETEIWRMYYEGPRVTYMVSNLGRVKRNGKLVEPKIHNGYCYISGGVFIHRIIAELFIPNPENKPCVDHINENKLDNRECNLRWVTHSENMNNPITKQKLIDTLNSEETRQKHSELMRGEKNPMWGKTPSEETKQKISESNKGKPKSEETRQKLSEAQKGKPKSEETKQKMSESRKKWHKEHTDAFKGEKNPNYGKEAWNKGQHGKCSEETLIKMSKSMIGKNKGKHRVYHPDGTCHYEF